MNRDERKVERRADGATSARGRLAGALAPLSAVLLVALPPSGLHADTDGRADRREPARTIDTTDAPAATRAADATGGMGNASPVLGGIGPQRLQVGRRWRLHVRARDPDGEPPRLLVRNLPTGATLAERRAGWYVLDWTPSAGAVGVDLTIVAVDARDPRLRSERVVRLELAPPSAISPSADTSLSPETPPVPRVAPRIEPLAAQVVSAGRTVAFKVAAAASADESVPLLRIDRLPRNASFDRNEDGSRTFYWPTGDSDQGEHRFHITALHPDDESLSSRVDLLVIVGDPTRAVTRPLDEGGGEAGGDGDLSPDASPDAFVADGQVSATDGQPAASMADTAAPSFEDEPFLPQVESDEQDYFGPESSYPPGEEATELPTEFLGGGRGGGRGGNFGNGPEQGLVGPEGDFFAPTGPDGLPFDP